jgi:hypothetical protein
MCTPGDSLVDSCNEFGVSASKSTVAVELMTVQCARLIICNLSTTMMHWFAI